MLAESFGDKTKRRHSTIRKTPKYAEVDEEGDNDSDEERKLETC